MPRLALRPSSTIAELLKHRRKELGLSLRDVQERTASTGTCIPFTTLAKVERGRVDPGVKRLHQLLKLYNLPLQLAGDLLDIEDLSDERPEASDLEVLYQDGLRHWKAGDTRKGLAHLLAVRDRSPEDSEGRVLRQKSLLSFAIAAGSLGKYQLSRQIVDDLLLEPPDATLLVPVLIQAATCWHWLGSKEGALAFLGRAETHAGPEEHQYRAWIHHENASTLASLGEFELAESELQRALHEYRMAHDLYGECKALGVGVRIRRDRGDTAGTLEAARAARAHAEVHGFDRLRMMRILDEGRAHVAMGDVAAGLSAFNAALSEGITTRDNLIQFYTHYNLWKAREASGDRELAEVELDAAKYFVRFVDETSEEVTEVRKLGQGREARKRVRAAFRREPPAPAEVVPAR